MNSLKKRAIPTPKDKWAKKLKHVDERLVHDCLEMLKATLPVRSHQEAEEAIQEAIKRYLSRGSGETSQYKLDPVTGKKVMRKGTRRQIWESLPGPILKTKLRLVSRDAVMEMLVERAKAVMAGKRAKAKHHGAPECSGAEPARADHIVGRKELLLSVLTAVEEQLEAELAKCSLRPDSPVPETTIF